MQIQHVAGGWKLSQKQEVTDSLASIGLMTICQIEANVRKGLDYRQ